MCALHVQVQRVDVFGLSLYTYTSALRSPYQLTSRAYVVKEMKTYQVSARERERALQGAAALGSGSGSRP